MITEREIQDKREKDRSRTKREKIIKRDIK